METINPQIQELGHTLSKRNIKNGKAYHKQIVQKMMINRKLLKEPEGKRHITYKETKIRMK